MEEEAAISYVLGLQTQEDRRAATAVARAELLAAVRALTGCQRCGFVEQVLAAFDPDLASGALTTMTSATPCGETSTVMAPSQLLALLSRSGGSTDLVGLLQFAWKDAGAGSTTSSGSRVDGMDGGVADGHGGAGAGGVLALSDTLLAKPRLLRRFLTDSIGAMQALADDVGDCRRHVGYPGPSELASTLARLDTQRRHTLERLAAWGVMRQPPAGGAAAAVANVVAAVAGGGGGGAGTGADADAATVANGTAALSPGCNQGPGQSGLRAAQQGSRDGCTQPPPPQQQQQRRVSPQRTGLRGGESIGGRPCARMAAAEHATKDALALVPDHLLVAPEATAAVGNGDDGGEDEDDPQLALAIRLSLQEAGMALGSPAVRQRAAAGFVPSPGPSPGLASRQGHQQQPSPQGPASPGSGLLRRPQRIPPRPTGGLDRTGGGGASPAAGFDGGVSGGGRGAGQQQWASPSLRGPGTWPGPSAGRSPGGAGAGGGGCRPGPLTTPSREALAACGLAVDVDEGPPPASLQPPAQPSPRAAQQASVNHNELGAGTWAREGSSLGPPAVATQPTMPPAPAFPWQQPSAGGGGAAGETPAPLPVSEAVSAAAGLVDASVLVDSAAVAALPEGLRHRVEQLVAQLVQVQQRRGRLEHACQHGVLAGGRKLLLLLLQLMWATLRQAATAAAAAAGDIAPARTAAEAEDEDVAAGGAAGDGASGAPSAGNAVGGVVASPTAGTVAPGASNAGMSPRGPSPDAGNAADAPASSASSLRLRPQPRQPPLPPLCAAPQPPSQPHPSRGQRLAPQPQSQPQPPPQVLPQPQPHRRPRYEGLLADLAAGLADDDMYLDILGRDLGLELGELEAEVEHLEPSSGIRPQSRPWPRSAMGMGLEDEAAGDEGAGDGRIGGGDLGNGDGGAGDDVDDDGDGGWLREVQPVVPPSNAPAIGATAERSPPPPLLMPPTGAESPGLGPRGGGAAAAERQPPQQPPPRRRRQRQLPLSQPSDSVGDSGGDGGSNHDDEGNEDDGGGWDAAHRNSVARWSVTSSAVQQRRASMAQALAGPGARRAGSVLFPADIGARPGVGSEVLGSTALVAGSFVGGGGGGGGGGGVRSSASFGPAERARWAALGREAAGPGGGGGGGCSADCLRARVEQAEQLRILQGQLDRCQASQTELQAETGRLLEMLGESRRRQEQAVSSLRRELAQWQGDPGALQGLGAEELAELAGRMEAGLARVRAAQLQAAAERDLMCAVCWERRIRSRSGGRVCGLA